MKPFRNVESARVKYLQVAEAKRFINACDLAFRPLAQAALQTGGRYGELTRLKVGDFNADSGTLAIWQSKSGKPRHVVLTTEGVAFFTELTAGRATGELMLPRANGDPWRKSNQAEFMAAACARAKITPNQLSRAAPYLGRLAVMAGMPLMVVAKNLGHVDTRQVEQPLRPPGAVLCRRGGPRACAQVWLQAAATSRCSGERMERAGLARPGTISARSFAAAMGVGISASQSRIPGGGAST